ncbi:MAG: GyrI-like domain-containing protein, partial [Promethearchaeota archaeon]
AANEVTKVDEIPEGMITETIPAQKYAVFTHLGKITNLGETFQYMLGDWVSNNTRYKRVQFVAALEWYGERYNIDSDDSELDLYLPIEVK